jgi:hypothetical protein
MPTRLSLAALALTLVAGAAVAQGPAPITGTVKSMDAGRLVIATATGDVDLALTPKTRVLKRLPASAAEIKAGAYLGTANVTTADGGVADEVHLMETGPNVNAPMAAPNTIMTNGHVKSVTATAKGQEMDVDYGGAQTRHVIVPAATPVSRMADTTLSLGAQVTARTTAGPDGKPTATYILVGPAS